MPLKGSISDRISEFHHGNVYAKTKAKHGKVVADRQAIAAAYNSGDQSLRSLYKGRKKKK